MKKGIIIVLVTLLFFNAFAQEKKSEDVLNYINQYKDIAIQEMVRTGVPASIKLAQGILESGSGKSTLSLMSNNHFGVKCKKTWKGEKVYFDDDAKGECFRKYDDPAESYRDQSNFLVKNPRYDGLFELNVLDYKGWSKGLKKAGYATNPKYANSLISLIEKYDLQQYSYETLVKQNKISQKQYKKYMAKIKATPSTILNTHHTLDSSASSVNPVKSSDLLGKILSNNFSVISSLPYGQVSKINNVKALKVKKGTSLIAIAVDYNIDYEDLLERNNIDNNQEMTNRDSQLIYLNRKKPKSKSADYHRVSENISLADISQMEGVRLESLKKLNPGVNSRQVLHENDIIWLR